MTSGGPALSVVITNYNYGRFLVDAVESVLVQGSGVEVIVVDDGSTDDSRRIISTLDRQVTTVLKPNGGQASAINLGFSLSTGPRVLFLDADDLLEPDVLDELVDALSHGVIHAHWQMSLVDGSGRLLGDLRPRTPGLSGDLRGAVAERGPGFLPVTPTSGNAFERGFLETALPMPTAPYRNGGGDLYLSWLAAASGPSRGVSRPLSRYRRHGANDNISGTTDERIDRGLGWAREGLRAVADRLGLTRDATSAWAGQEWWHLADAVREAVRATVPAQASVLIADDHLWAVRDTFAGRAAVQLSADDDAGLVRQMDAALGSGAMHLVVPSFCSWWFDHFPQWAAWVESRARTRHVTPVAVVCELRSEV